MKAKLPGMNGYNDTVNESDGIALLILIEAVSYQRETKNETMLDIVRADQDLYTTTQHEHQSARKYLESLRTRRTIVAHHGAAPWNNPADVALILKREEAADTLENRQAYAEQAEQEYMAALALFRPQPEQKQSAQAKDQQQSPSGHRQRAQDIWPGAEPGQQLQRRNQLTQQAAGQER